MKGMRISAFWQAVFAVVAAYLFFDNMFVVANWLTGEDHSAIIPRTLMIQYMIISVIGVLLYFAYDDQRWKEFKAPILATLRNDDRTIIRWGFLVGIPLIVGYTVNGMVLPSTEAPVELRQVHPAPPASMRAFGKSYDLAALENPVREAILETMQSDPGAGWERYQSAVLAGRDVYYQNCFYCHGDLLDGKGHYAGGFNPQPINFQDPTIIPQLQESFLFWRITTGGPGLPKEGTPWNSAMPVWHEMLSEEDVWNVITFIFDYNGQVPRIWDSEVSKQVTGMKDTVVGKRKGLQGKALYMLRCEVCHGEFGMGDGVAADRMYPRPRDFSLALFKYKTSPGTLLPRDDDLFNTIKHGLPGTGMPGWASLMSDDQIRSLIPVIKSFDITAAWPPEDADDDAYDDEGRYTRSDFIQVTEDEPLAGQIPFSEESVAKGRQAFIKSCKE